MVGLSSLYTAPADEPVSVETARAHLRLDTADDDTTVSRLVTAARRWVERTFWLGLVTQAWDLTLSEFPTEDYIELPNARHLASITSVSYVDGDGATQVWSSANYVADALSRPGRLRLAYGAGWPSTRAQWNAVTIRYVVGWAAASVPAEIVQAILFVLSWLYEHREDDAEPPRAGVAALMGDYSLSPGVA